MTASQALSGLRRAFLPALVAAALAMGVVLLLLLTREPSFQARVGVIAAPSASSQESTGQYGSVVSLAMPALPELAVSAPVVRAATAQLPDMTPDLFMASVTVEVVPESGVARVTVTGRSADMATALLDVVVSEIVASEFMSSVATFQVIGTADVLPVPVRPDALLALGLGALTAAAVWLLSAVAVQMFRPALLTLDDIETVIDQTGYAALTARRARRRPMVLVLGRRQRGLELLLSQIGEAAPRATAVHTYAIDPDDDRLGRLVSQRLGQRARDVQPVEQPHNQPALVPVRLRRTTGEQLTTALIRAQERDRAVFVVAHDGASPGPSAFALAWDTATGPPQEVESSSSQRVQRQR